MSYVPDRGDIVWLNFTPQAGQGQQGTRSAIIISPKIYNKKTNLALCCPITSREKGYPFEVQVKGKNIDGVILSDHMKNFDWRARNAKFIEKASHTVLNQCIEKLSTLISS